MCRVKPLFTVLTKLSLSTCIRPRYGHCNNAPLEQQCICPRFDEEADDFEVFFVRVVLPALADVLNREEFNNNWALFVCKNLPEIQADYLWYDPILTLAL